jgi:broad specificity phosphatase PhoE
MSTLIFVTHPDVDVDPSRPRSEWTLSTKGFEELQNLIAKDFWGNIKSIFCSKEFKASQVAEKIAEVHNLKVIKIDGLEEINRESTGFLPEEKYRLAIEDFYIHPADSYKGWETAYEATERIKECVNRLVKESEDSYFVIIGHGMIGSCLSCWIKGIDPTFNEDNGISSSYITIDWDNKKIIHDWEKY